MQEYSITDMKYACNIQVLMWWHFKKNYNTNNSIQ